MIYKAWELEEDWEPLSFYVPFWFYFNLTSETPSQIMAGTVTFNSSASGPERVVVQNGNLPAGTLVKDDNSVIITAMRPEANQGYEVSLLPADIVTINTFIPHNNVEDPRPFTGTLFKADNRNSGTPSCATWDENGSHRTQQKFQVIADQTIDSNGLFDNAFGTNADGNGNSDRYVHIGETKSFDPSTSVDSSGNITAAALADSVTGAPLMIGKATAPQTEAWLENPHFVAPKKFTVKCRFEASNPLVSRSPAISYTINITIDKAAGTYSIEGSHDGFAAYEIYINGKRIYQHEPLATGDGLNSLFPDEEYDINEFAKPLP